MEAQKKADGSVRFFCDKKRSAMDAHSRVT